MKVKYDGVNIYAYWYVEHNHIIYLARVRTTFIHVMICCCVHVFILILSSLSKACKQCNRDYGTARLCVPRQPARAEWNSFFCYSIGLSTFIFPLVQLLEHIFQNILIVTI